MSTKIMQKRLYDSVSLPFKFVALLWLIHLIQSIFHLNLGVWGIYPREEFGLPGIITAPLIHADFPHLLSNTPPLFVLSAMIMFFYRRVALSSFALIYLLTGAAVWVFGRPVFHIGASGVIYGLAAFVVFSGIFRRNLKSIALALLVGLYYGSMIYGIFPGQEGVSWESHLLGAVVGVFASFVYKNSIEKDEQRQIPSWENDPNYNQEQFFLDRDAFNKTKQEREKETRNNEWFR